MKKMEMPMDGKTFNECWVIDNVDIKDNDNVVVNFINDIMVNVFVNGSKIWSVINSIR
jgi:hypothetical protein